QLGAAQLEPAGEAFVQLGADCFRERVVGCVADQQVAEAEAVVAREHRPVRPDQLPAHERGEPGRDVQLLGGERLHTAAVENLALDGAALQYPSLGGRSEEHTSELQSLAYLVCRLLLEKHNNIVV